MKRVFLTKSARETQALAAALAKELRGGEVIALEGELGAGKTTFVQGLAKGLGIKETVLSPTFVLMKFFAIPRPSTGSECSRRLIHVDCYRIESPNELLRLGWRDILREKSNIIVIEWAEKIRKILPRSYLRAVFQLSNKNERKIIFEF